ncbi:Chitinase 2 [Recurvomyces mirabilis]|uniref:chitinase n=1 Tax=Recurvomyces mirabilis TaxID=574656 RepID=A0AAE0WJW8_9PEZI|nr:Chitinase 2 [Recurvomyces mirabilis]KAK5150856.1 Chitinase 2 [Recurvomyces mirabilis]
MSTRSLLLAATAATTISATFSATSNTNVNPSIDIVNIGFVNVFPDQGPGGWPGTNFGNQCSGEVYVHNGVNTTLQKSCPYIEQDIKTCQTTYGKKVFLSLGGANPNNYYLDSDTSGESFADFLWGAFGPASANNGQPRPFGSAVVDGFDFDIESAINPAPTDANGKTIAYATNGYAAMINHFKNDLYTQDVTKSYYISGAPQCSLPDVHLTSVISAAWFDFVFIQFYNTPACSARAGINHLNGQGSDDISFASWQQSASLNPAVKYYIGLPAAKAASSDDSYYLTTLEAQKIVKEFANTTSFGGVMLWEATYDQNNTICGSPYSVWMKEIVTAAVQGTTFDADTTSKCPALIVSPDVLQPVRVLWFYTRLLWHRLQLSRWIVWKCSLVQLVIDRVNYFNKEQLYSLYCVDYIGYFYLDKKLAHFNIHNFVHRIIEHVYQKQYFVHIHKLAKLYIVRYIDFHELFCVFKQHSLEFSVKQRFQLDIVSFDLEQPFKPQHIFTCEHIHHVFFCKHQHELYFA